MPGARGGRAGSGQGPPGSRGECELSPRCPAHGTLSLPACWCRQRCGRPLPRAPVSHPAWGTTQHPVPVTTVRNAVHAQHKPIFASHEALRWQSRCVAAVGARGPPTPGAALVLGVLLGGPPCSRVLVRNTGPSRPGPAEDQGCSRAASAPCSVTKTRHPRVPHTRSACSLGPAALRPGTAEGHGRGSRALWSEPCGSRALWEPCRGGHACPATGRPPHQRAAPP